MTLVHPPEAPNEGTALVQAKAYVATMVVGPFGAMAWTSIPDLKQAMIDAFVAGVLAASGAPPPQENRNANDGRTGQGREGEARAGSR